MLYRLIANDAAKLLERLVAAARFAPSSLHNIIKPEKPASPR